MRNGSARSTVSTKATSRYLARMKSSQGRSFSRPTFADNAHRPRGLESFRETLNRQCLRRQRLAQYGRYLLRNRVIWSLNRRVHLDDARAELLRVGPQIFKICIHGSPKGTMEMRRAHSLPASALSTPPSGDEVRYSMCSAIGRSAEQIRENSFSTKWVRF
jgi:hypothetical protein